MRHSRFVVAVAVVPTAFVLFLACGCAKFRPDPFGNLPPEIDVTYSPQPADSVQYIVTIHWAGSDADGQVVGYRYAVDPPVDPVTAGVDTEWVDTRESSKTLIFRSRTPRNPLPAGAYLPSSDYHTFVVEAIDNEGARSVPVSRSFTTFTIAPASVITLPNGTAQLAIGTTPSLTIQWTGDDPDGTSGPVRYKYKLVPTDEVDIGDPNASLAEKVQKYFEQFSVNGFADWDSVGGDTTSIFLEGLTPLTRYLFAVVAFDEAGAYEPRFNMDSNVLWFMPSLDRLGPTMTIFNEFVSYTQKVGGVNPNATSRWLRLQFPAGSNLVFNWSAQPPRPGVFISGYRWCVDIADVGDETPREDDFDIRHWSTWSLNETSARLDGFPARPGEPSVHFFYLEARDNLGFVSLLTVRLAIVEPSFNRPLLLVDDLYGTPTQAVSASDPDGPLRLPSGGYPIEAEQDTFYVAQGGVPDQLYERAGFPGVISARGIFTDYLADPDRDTLDYRSYPSDGIDLERLSSYRAVCWYTDNTSAARNGRKFGDANPMTALRAINMVNHLNTLAVYARQGGHVWLFGEGATTAIGTGFYSRIGGNPPLPYTSGEETGASLVPGNFLYDFCHLRSELSQGGNSTFRATQLLSCLPNLPEFEGPASDADRSHDPRVGPGAARTAERWDGLPRLTVRAYRGAPAEPAINATWYISKPNRIFGPPPLFLPTADTLYLYQAREYDLARRYGPYSADGFPNAIHYHGEDNGPGSQLVWFGFPLHYFELDQARAVVGLVMRNFGIEKAAPPAAGRGRVARR